MRTRILISITLAASVLILAPNVFAKTASCPCSPCKCSPCTCGAGGASKGGKHHEKERGHEHGGVGVNVDLGGVGQRKAEPNPFGVTNEPSTSTTTHEKTTTKHPAQPIATTFDKVELTTDKAKDLETADTGTGGGPPVAGGAINVSNDTPTPAPQTQEKPAAQANSDDDCRKRLKQLIEAAQEVARLGQIWAAIEAELRRWDDIVQSCDLKLEKARHEKNSLHAAVEGGEHPEEADNYQKALDRLEEAERERERAGQKRSDVADTAVAAHRAFLAAIESYEKLRIAYERDCHERAPAPPKIPAIRAQPPQPGRAMVEMNRPKGLTADEFKTRTRKTIKGWRELAKGAKDPADARHYNAEADRLEKMLEEMR